MRSRVMDLYQTQSTTRGPHLFLNGRIRSFPCATPVPRRSFSVNDAEALAPVVFSGGLKNETRKIRGINGKGGPYPPKSTLLNPMVASVLAETACNTRFDSNRSLNPNNGNRNT